MCYEPSFIWVLKYLFKSSGSYVLYESFHQEDCLQSSLALLFVCLSFGHVFPNGFALNIGIRSWYGRLDLLVSLPKLSLIVMNPEMALEETVFSDK